jgi:hypothetical protein
MEIDMFGLLNWLMNVSNGQNGYGCGLSNSTGLVNGSNGFESYNLSYF